MRTDRDEQSGLINYHLRLSDSEEALNTVVGKKIKLQFEGEIHCIHCDRKIKKTFAQGYCYPCFQSLAETDMCIVKPHQCHFAQGTCRDEEFAKKHCFIPHVVYLAVSSGAKVGITRAHQKFTRWADQGAIKASVLAEVPDRKTAGDLEVALSEHIADKTNWRKMLSNQVPSLSLSELKNEIKNKVPKEFEQFLIEDDVHDLSYPVEVFPEKISSYNLDKTPVIEDQLMGIKGQYLVFPKKVINLRKYQGYKIKATLS
ncbi:MAG: DUF2797 domain-containing protein [Deltaproteobacteria bacterium]|nr:DUF2797 domain-containing protein [Deltaproteobacteria bacterium]